MRLLLLWLLNTVALLAVGYLMPSITITSFTAGLMAALVLGFVNTLIRPVLVLLTLPLTVLTLGIFYLVINGLLFWAVGSFMPGFQVAGFWSAMIGAVLYGAIAWVLSSLLLPNKNKKAEE